MTLAKEAGLEVTEVEQQRAGSIDFLQVTRYDRTENEEGQLERIHQEDFCQAMGIVPELKYQLEGGPNLKQCFSLIREISSTPGPDLLRFFDAVIFNYLIGNNDAHGKNFSFLYHREEARLAPLYDLVCTRAYPEFSDEMAMKIGGERNPNRLRSRSWEKFFQEAGLSATAAAKRAKAMKSRIQQALSRMKSCSELDRTISELIRHHLNEFDLI